MEASSISGKPSLVSPTSDSCRHSSIRNLMPCQAAQRKRPRTARLSPLPGAATRAPAPRKRAHVQRRDGNLLPVQRRIALQDLIHRCTLGKHVSHQVDMNPGPFEDWCPAHDVRVADHHLLHARELLQLALHLSASGPDFDAKGAPGSDGQLVSLRRSLDRCRDLPPGPERQKSKAFGLKLEKDQLLFGEQAPDGRARARDAGANQPAVNRLVNRGQRQTGQGSGLRGRVETHALILHPREKNYGAWRDRCILREEAEAMEVRFTPELEAKLAHSAARQGRTPDELVQDALTRYLDEEARFVGAVKRGEEAFERGAYLTHEQVGQHLERFLKP